MSLSASVVVNGMDLRARFGLEILGVRGNRGLSMRRNETDLPQKHGVYSDSGRYEAQTIQLAGWIEIANRGALIRAITSDTRFPTETRQTGQLILASDPTVIYAFDSVESIQFDPQTNQWRLDAEFNVVLEFRIVDALPRRQSYTPGLGSGYSNTGLAGAASNPDFMFLQNDDESDVKGMLCERGRIQLGGPADNPRIVAAEMGMVHTFDRTLSGNGTLGTDVVAELWGLQAGNLVTDPDMEVTGVTDWSASAASISKVGITADGRRVIHGNQCLKVTSNSAGGGVLQAVSPTGALDYLVSFWVYRADGAGGTVDVSIGPTGTPVATHTGLGVLNQWVLVEFVARAAGAGSWDLNWTISGSAKTFYVDQVRVVPSVISNGSMEGGFGGGTPTGWSLSGGSGTDDSANQRTGDHAWDVTLGTGTYATISMGTLTAGTIYRLTAWAKRTAGTGDLYLLDSGSAGTLNMRGTLETDTWVRISAHFIGTSGGTGTLYIAGTAAVDLILDDVAVVELAEKTGADPYHFEPGVYGYRLQMSTGDCVKIADWVNRHGNTIAAQMLPLFDNGDAGVGNTLLWQACKNRDNLFQLTWERGTFRSARATATDGRINSAAVTVGILEGSTRRGVLGVVTRFSSGYVLGSSDNGMRLYVERPGTGSDGFEQAAEADTDTDTTPFGSTPDTILLGDGCHWDAFWVRQYPDEFPESDLSPAEAPANRNLAMVYGAVLDEPDSLFVDLDNYRVERFESDNATTKLANAMDDVTGDLPRWRRCPVLFSNTDIGLVRANVIPEG